MTTEFVLLLALYAFILIGVFLGDQGPMATFREAGPRFGALVERNVSTGHGFTNPLEGRKSIYWVEPNQ